jgi:hypothetical protein
MRPSAPLSQSFALSVDIAALSYTGDSTKLWVRREAGMPIRKDQLKPETGRAPSLIPDAEK